MGPQCEDGYTRIANELLEALCRIRIPGESMQVFLVILRKTYGFCKKEDTIALSQLEEATGIIKTHIPRAVEKLVSMRIVTKKGNGTSTSYGINKHYQSWQALPKKVTLPKKVMKVTQKGNEQLPKKVHTKETKEKRNILGKCFEYLWNKYPVKDGRKAAERHFNATVTNVSDGRRCEAALENYLSHLTAENRRGFAKRAKNGSTWFNNWGDWVPDDYDEETYWKEEDDEDREHEEG